MRLRLANILALSAFLTFSALQGASAAPAAATDSAHYLGGVRIGGWIGNDALLVLPDRSAGAAAIGHGFGPVKLVSIGNTSYTIDYAGQSTNVSLDPAWQLAPHPDLTDWLISFMKSVGDKIDHQSPDTTQEGVIRILASGAAASNFLKVQQASPFQKLPDWMESVDIKVSINPHDPTRVAFMSMVITPAAYDRLLKPMYAVPAVPVVKQ